jgi:predicted SAM-dependent methyltransferase
MRKLEIGSGNRPLPGYEHLDIDPKCPDVDYVSSMDKIPVEDNVFDEIISIHSIEHIGWRKGIPTLKEWYRVLKPGGKLRVACPNLRFICQAYLENGKQWRDDFVTLHPDEKKHLVVNGFHSHSFWTNFKLFSSGEGGDEHMACYDAFILGHMLKEAGFKKTVVIEDASSLVMEAWK